MKNQLFRQNKTICALFYFVLLFASCKKEVVKNSAQNDQVRNQVSNTEALNIGCMVAKELFKSKAITLKSANATDAIAEMYPVGEDTSMYVVNYKGNNGFVVISGDKATAPVIMTGYIGSYNYYTGIWPFRTVHTIYSGGHAWVCSGFLELITLVNGSQGELDYLWMNWGHPNASSNNGWCLNTANNFTEGVYNNTFQYCLNTVYNIHP
jgi:Spi protease inhibitor